MVAMAASLQAWPHLRWPAETRLRDSRLRPCTLLRTNAALELRQQPVQPTEKLSCCEAERRLRLAVLVSGGVDSSVALRLLCAAGHSCTAFYLKIWFQDDFENYWSECPWEEDVRLARAVCDEAGVELQIVHLTDVYWNTVVSRCIAEVKAGRTPNPDILCNSMIKFGAFLDHIDMTEFEGIASGHYARVGRLHDRTGKPLSVLKLSKDKLKDQTYFLSQLSQKQLAQLIFPLGDLTKHDVRDIARALELPNMDRKDSQGICFLGKVKFSEFIARHLGEKEGLLVEAETGKTMGTHKGFWFYTIGQRRGIGLSGGPWYVVAKDTVKNLVFISKTYFSGGKQRRSFHVSNLNWFTAEAPSTSHLKCKIRHGPNFHDCELQYQNNGAVVRLFHEDEALAAGQYAAFYEGDTCLGSGIISDALEGLETCTVSPESLWKAHQLLLEAEQQQQQQQQQPRLTSPVMSKEGHS